MEAAHTESNDTLICLRPSPSARPYEVYVLPVSQFPIPEMERLAVRDFLDALSAVMRQTFRLRAEIFLQLNQLRLDGGPLILEQHAAEWMPLGGLGVWPDRESPRVWKPEDFMNLGVGDTLRPSTYQVFRITKSPQVAVSARNLMLGRGTVVEILTSDSIDSFFKRTAEVLLPSIKETSLRGFRFFVPLFERKSFEAASAADLDSWFCGASVYVRESIEDKGVLIASREPLGQIFEKLGAKFVDKPEPHWQVPRSGHRQEQPSKNKAPSARR